MAESSRIAGALCLLPVLSVPFWTGGCGAPPATLELIAVAQEALSGASEVQSARHADELARLETVKKALDAAFDADAKLAEAGKILDSAGDPVPFTAEWVVSARKGYAVARDALAEQRSRLEAGHRTHLDNLAAAGQALELAKTLILQQSALTGRAREFLAALARRESNDR